jgi:catechol 2,3-dioxygenase-like lactoylglutathione lyase family enzyme
VEQFDRSTFDHVGLVTDTPQPGEIHLASEGCWVTDPRDHPASIEWIRWEADSPQRDDRPHVAFRVDDIEAAVAGQKVLSPPATTGLGGMWAFIEAPDGAVIELLQYDDPDAYGWAGRRR